MILSQQSKQDADAFQTYASQSYEHWRNLEDCMKTFSIFHKQVRQALDNYFLLYWEPSFVLQSLAGDDKNIIYKNGIRYYVIYQELLSPEYLEQYPALRLSFRKLKDMEYGFVLIRAAKEKIGNS
mgnify:CR=1 FL=1